MDLSDLLENYVCACLSFLVVIWYGFLWDRFDLWYSKDVESCLSCNFDCSVSVEMQKVLKSSVVCSLTSVITEVTNPSWKTGGTSGKKNSTTKGNGPCSEKALKITQQITLRVLFPLSDSMYHFCLLCLCGLKKKSFSCWYEGYFALSACFV